MQCPKCGSSQPVTNKECPTCGIVFDRWSPRVPRRTTASSTPVPPSSVDPESTRFQIPSSYAAVALVVLAIVGFMFTKHARSSRPTSNSVDETINQINNSGSKLRSDLQNGSRRAGNVVHASAMPSRSKLPPDLDESKIRDIIESCSFFQSDVSVDIPKHLDGRSVLSLSRSNTMATAVRDHLIEFDPPIDSNLPYGESVNVNVTQYASAKVMVSDNGSSYRFGLGRRHAQITSAHEQNTGVSVTFTWTLDQNDVADLAPEGANPSGGAELYHTASGWNLKRAWQTNGGIVRYICQ